MTHHFAAIILRIALSIYLALWHGNPAAAALLHAVAGGMTWAVVSERRITGKILARYQNENEKGA